MKLAVLAVACLAFGLGLKSGFATPKKTTLVVAGDLFGYLAPCGCTKPMAGGIARWNSAVKALRKTGPTVVVVNGGLVDGTSRQDELKAETLAESFRTAGAAAINLTVREARLGAGELGALDRLSGNALASSSVAESETFEFKHLIESEPFLVGAVETKGQELVSKLEEAGVETERAAKELLREAESKGLTPVLLYAGDLSGARAVARSFPRLAAIVYQGSSPPSGAPEKEGSTVLLTPGEKGRVLVSMTWDGRSFGDYRVLLLGPEFTDDDETLRATKRYLGRVGEEGLLEMMPRKDGPDFAGNEVCSKCHSEAARVWKDSLHAKALKTLETEGHDRDPDCVGCHVVGLDTVPGFKSRSETPHLTDVGCESCHGAGATHSRDPLSNKMGKAGRKACMPCHVGDHSPKFEFDTYWARVKH